MARDGQTTLPQAARCYVTWGGGGAFLHPTDQLQDVAFPWEYPAPPPVTPSPGQPKDQRSFETRCVYPSPQQSRRLARRLPLFAWDNPWFAALMFAGALVAAWTLAAVADFKGKRLPASLYEAQSTAEALASMAGLLLSAPWFSLACLALVAVLMYFSAAQDPRRRWLVGLVHFTAHLAAFLAVFLIVARSALIGGSLVLLVVIVAAATALVSSTIMGLYLWISLAFFRRHWNEAFSALRIKDYKGFLRLHFDRTGVLTVYPIALDTVPKGGEGALKAKLIEGPLRLPETDGRPVGPAC